MFSIKTKELSTILGISEKSIRQKITRLNINYSEEDKITLCPKTLEQKARTLMVIVSLVNKRLRK